MCLIPLLGLINLVNDSRMPPDFSTELISLLLGHCSCLLDPDMSGKLTWQKALVAVLAGLAYLPDEDSTSQTSTRNSKLNHNVKTHL